MAPRPPRTARLGIATATIIAVALIRLALFAGFAPWFLFTPAVVAVTLFLGGGAGLWATVLSALCAAYVLLDVEPIGALSATQWIASAIFLATTSGLVGMVVAMRNALCAADAAQAKLNASALALAEREAFLSSVLASSTDCIKVLDLDGKLTFMSEGGQRVMEVSDFNDIAGCPWPDFWVGAGNAEAVAALAAARRGQAKSFIGRANTFKGTPKWWHVAVSPIRGTDAQPDRILSVSRDVTALRESEEERDRFVRLIENSTDFIAMAHIDGRAFFMNDAAKRLVGLGSTDITTLTIADFFPPEQMEMVTTDMLATVNRDGHWSGETVFRHFRTGEPIPMLQTVFSVTDPDGQSLGYGTVARDFRARKRAEEDLRLMNGELAHRLKNVLAVVQSITRQSLRNATDIKTASSDLSERLVALGTATDVLTDAGWQSASLQELIERALVPHGQIGERILLEGPPVALQPQVAVALALALHELATNAAKYGALSNDTGTVTVAWRVDGEGPAARFRLDWRERGGPPVSPPSRRGFGSTVIERSLQSYFKGTASADYRPDGLVFALDAPLAEAVRGEGSKAKD